MEEDEVRGVAELLEKASRSYCSPTDRCIEPMDDRC